MTIPAPAADLWTLLDRELAGNTVERWIAALAVFAAVAVALGVVRRMALARLAKIAERTATDLDDLFVDLVRRTGSWFLVALGVYAASHFVILEDGVRTKLGAAVVVLGLFQAGLWGQGLVAYAIRRMMRFRTADDPARTMGGSILGFIGRVLVWSAVLVLALDNVGVDVTALIAGLGVGGIAVALALQNILGDLFASITILLDKPFVVGDFIILGEFMGTVERIGIKTTRLRSLTGEEIVIGNNDLVSSRVRNYKRMRERRQVFSIGVTYDTPRDKLARIPGLLREIVAQTPDTRLDRAHFKGFGDFSLNFEVVYFMLNPDYTAMMDAQQKINLAICEAFESEGIEFAFPTQTLHHVVPAGWAPAQKELSRG